jgi:hypothetical protein
MTLKPISAEGFSAPQTASDLGAAPHLAWLPIDKLVVDQSYQRFMQKQGRRNVARIADTFRWSHFMPVMVSPIEGGLYAIIDGQHRCTAALLRGIKEVPCSIIVASTAEQAKAFAVVNGNITRVHKMHIYHASVAAGDPRAADLEAVLKSVGVEIARYPGPPRRNASLSVQAIMKVYRQHGGDVLAATFKCLMAATHVPDMSLLRAHPIAAVSAILADHREWLADDKGLLAIFECLDVEEMLQKARSKAALHKGVSISDLLQADLIEAIERNWTPKKRKRA